MEQFKITSLKRGETVVAVGTRDCSGHLTYGKRYQAMIDLQQGIVPSKDYLTIVKGDQGRPFTCYISRFVKEDQFAEWEKIYGIPDSSGEEPV